ncbi:hypothetical protein [Arthrobacter oryzae]|uniref:hypothetical protein n=1 Tax=Arthrobacter oryzae TaxID=409290 RepID=UPI00273B665F|nr:hypothetical protein [Arthrobacter oryzae]WLQ06100.1 hypothetical protein Q8Z05_18740 [Arthrobacter oryzae]
MKFSPAPLEAALSAPAEWWQIVAALGPLAVLAGAVLAAFIGWRTLRQSRGGRPGAEAKNAG